MLVASAMSAGYYSGAFLPALVEGKALKALKAEALKGHCLQVRG